MIWESHYWKKPLLEMADRLERLKASDDLSDEQMAQIERDVFIGFYSVRKLFEAPTKVTDQTRGYTLSLQRHSNIKPVTWRNHHKLDELYDLSKSGNEIRDVLFVCGRLIHSFVFAACVSDTGGLHGAFFNSDRDKDSCLYFITIDAVISLFRIVGNDDPCHIEWSRNEGSGEGRLVVW
ncbi:hypothetical protein KIE16_04965 [Pseudomonas syringae]|uniref:hypothetical protein n=1 Tax=Pseudomonas syringae TaxID=317 RepID=UPI001BCE16A2|nr:hypothetical protein [Pseudomonas syringae]MBS7422329.1 hypothetical protein [Pseudomonas syringae]